MKQPCPLIDYAPMIITCKLATKELDKSLPLQDWERCQEQAAKLLRAAQELHDYVIDRAIEKIDTREPKACLVCGTAGCKGYGDCY